MFTYEVLFEDLLVVTEDFSQYSDICMWLFSKFYFGQDNGMVYCIVDCSLVLYMQMAAVFIVQLEDKEFAISSSVDIIILKIFII